VTREKVTSSEEALPHQHLLLAKRMAATSRISLTWRPVLPLEKPPAEALKQVQIAKQLWLQAAKSERKRIPQPRYRPAIYQTAS
jgi:hypothetical protein